MLWYWILGALLVVILMLAVGAVMAKKTESVLVGEVWAVFSLIVFVGVYFLIGALLR